MMTELHARGKTADDVRVCLQGAPLDAHVVSAITTASALGCDLRVVSDANTFFIDTVLEHHGVLLRDQHQPGARGRRRQAQDLAVPRLRERAPWVQPVPGEHVQGMDGQQDGTSVASFNCHLQSFTRRTSLAETRRTS
jgi:hypothetical protein